jgi:hypothetical protein
MDKFSHYLSMASICSGRALEDKERRSEWLGWAEVWNELAEDAIYHPFEERNATAQDTLPDSSATGRQEANQHAINYDGTLQAPGALRSGQCAAWQ